MTVLVAQRGFDIGSAIRELRDENVFTQRELAKLAGLHEITISDLERGERRASAKTVRKLAAAFGFDAQELLKRARSIEAENRIPDTPGLTDENVEKLEARKQELRKQDGIEETGSTDGDSL